MKISELSVDYVSFDDDDKEISAIAISYKDNSGKEQRRWLEKPRRIGLWKKCKSDALIWWECSVCGVPHYLDEPRNVFYCPYCGVKMDESEDNNNE